MIMETLWKLVIVFGIWRSGTILSTHKVPKRWLQKSTGLVNLCFSYLKQTLPSSPLVTYLWHGDTIGITPFVATDVVVVNSCVHGHNPSKVEKVCSAHCFPVQRHHVVVEVVDFGINIFQAAISRISEIQTTIAITCEN